ncbi:hypothetical protein OW684_09765 [Acinetobacter baumannii]|uniref:hypothetical protein n=1 Tax=Acinetobacter baumannii TaxID=470 RepID=UPI00233E87B7|nr:hypothetical protein [Acinetobacter baumannii]MDC4276330.1 hypothetical protein [Acinetobacter baumannii]MDC4318723.1 hypothetical protein [Acinetobacter baumannii]MDC4399545.1 hypothetical protein [Acinetobacter baumannii]MDC4869144.1 hypothetical protein [Acinetobacter baumannii]MDC5381271.1 hypothetical protein [Acinetobacter baumannii]
MKTFKMVRLLTCGLLSLLMCSVATAKTEKITLKQNIGFGEEAVIFNTTKGEVILNMYALPERVAKQIKPFKKGQCLEVQSKYGFFQDTGDGQYIQSIQPCKQTSSKAK